MTIGILFIVILFLVSYILHLKTRQVEIVSKNKEQEQQNFLIDQTNKDLEQKQKEIRQQLHDIKDELSSETERLTNLTQKNEELEASAGKRAEEFYQKRIEELKTTMELNLKTIEENYQEQKATYLEGIEKYKDELADIKNKQEAYIRDQQRRLEMETKKDFYRLQINDSDKDDITLLREMQIRFVRKEAIDKLIWEVYFKKPYDALMSRLALDSTKKSGIYKITSLTTGQVYIGQSVDTKERLRTHIKTALSSTPASNKLYQAMKKYGPENFTFEVLEEVSRDKLNEREVYWIDFYKSREFGLNGTKGNGA